MIIGIDVIIVVLDRASTLSATLDSVTSQRAVPGVEFQVTVVDGGSTDGSREIARRAPQVTVHDQRGTGLGNARNEGLGATSRELVAFLDADDRWTTPSLAVRLGALLGDVAIDGVIGHFVIDSLGGPLPERFRSRTD